LHPTEAQPGPRLYHGPELEGFQDLRRKLETGWVSLLCDRVHLDRGRTPLLWDCDFMLGEDLPGGGRRYVLCEINVSSVSPFPPSCIDPIVSALRQSVHG
jgi:hypothetical protein